MYVHSWLQVGMGVREEEYSAPGERRVGFTGMTHCTCTPDTILFLLTHALTLQPLSNKGGLLHVRQNLDVSLFEALQLRLRGDGRTYICNIQTDGV